MPAIVVIGCISSSVDHPPSSFNDSDDSLRGSACNSWHLVSWGWEVRGTVWKSEGGWGDGVGGYIRF